ncbi:hypothetical protein [Bradyrhizobium sp. SRS-191]|uniref:hypothetical protein n=1 Tax=Bradyrhizobium sp. SRS-191 TaxID=2962606 RepID=UPI00211F243A|nr:hypothetical protein [Bradyrhizobium sp. SRS-191]
MTTYLRRAEDRKRAILDDAPDTKFEFESQNFADIPKGKRPAINNPIQWHAKAAQAIKSYDPLIEAAARRNGINPDLVRAIIYTEASRGGYGYYFEAADQSLRSALGFKRDHLSHTILPGNLDPSWQQLIPNSDVHKPEDNIELTARLIAGIAKRLDDPSVENVYALYNSLSHDRTYVNKEIKSTPYYAKRAFEAKAWEKDDWSAPDVTVPSADGGAPGRQDARTVRQDQSSAQDMPAWFADRFGRWLPESGNDMSQSALLRELARRRNAEAAAAQAMPPGITAPSLSIQDGQGTLGVTEGVTRPGVPDTVRAPIRILRSRRADQMPSADPAGSPGIGPNQFAGTDQDPSFDDRFGSWAASGKTTAPLSPYQQLLPMPTSRASVGVLAGDAMPDYPFQLPEFGDTPPGQEDWAGTRTQRPPWWPSR